MTTELSDRAKERIESARLIIKSVEFLESHSNELMRKIKSLQDEYDVCSDFERKEALSIDIEFRNQQLGTLIRRCELEYQNLQKMIHSPV